MRCSAAVASLSRETRPGTRACEPQASWCARRSRRKSASPAALRARNDRSFPARDMSAASRTEFLILGGGPTGLGAACRLQEKGQDWHLLEATPTFGGLA